MALWTRCNLNGCALLCVLSGFVVKSVAFEGLKELSDIADTLGKVLAGDACTYTCSEGQKPITRKGHTPSSNGCGSFGIRISSDLLPQMTKCCDKHDYCYDTCGSEKAICDKDFKICLTNLCKQLKGTLTTDQYSGCKQTAKLFFGGTSLLGCQSFLDAQEKACDCPKATNNSSFKKKQKPIKNRNEL